LREFKLYSAALGFEETAALTLSLDSFMWRQMSTWAPDSLHNCSGVDIAM